jgi:hypothetical protein
MATRRADLEATSLQGPPGGDRSRRSIHREDPEDSMPERPFRSADPSPFSRAIAGTAEDRAERIARAAYFRAERRGFAPGHELEDWLAAEREIDQLFASGRDA